MCGRRCSCYRAGCKIFRILEKPCKKSAGALNTIKANKCLIAGCAFLEKIGFYDDVINRLNLKKGNFHIVDIKSDVFDRYEASPAIKNNLYHQLKAGAAILANKESFPLKKTKQNSAVLIYGSGFCGLNTALNLLKDNVTIDILETPEHKISPGMLSKNFNDN